MITTIGVFALGIILGSIFFGGLWLTVKYGVTSKIPVVIFTVSFFIRTGITLVGFYYIYPNGWKKILICLLGFIIARFIINQMIKSKKKEVTHEA
ncbi:MAG TPA: ATP synthase subunit I [Cytophagaceae bacterium]|nr:ATP synthase subunit I [Cytophagaceae bacterium]